jgi:hypothetical protein
VTIAARFTSALAEVSGPAVAAPELLPVRLSRACASVLGVDGAGLGMADGHGRWLPLGASDATAATAERLQFEAGEGPCRTSLAVGTPVLAVEAELLRRWPAFAEQLLRGTPYRAVIALPLGRAPWGSGAVDLYLRTSAAVADIDVFAATAVAELTSTALSDATIWATWPPDGDPPWLRGPHTRDRVRVWQAMGRVCMDLGVTSEEALALLRSDASAAGRPVEAVADDLLAGRRDPADLRPG